MEAVVMSASTGALEVLVPKLGKLLTDKYKLHTGAKDGIKYIQNELESMQAALEKVSTVPPDQLDKLVNIWARNVRKMSYNIEDTIDSFTVLVDAADGKSDVSSRTCCVSMIGKSKLLQRYKARESIATEIERIKMEVEELSNRRDRYKIDSITVAPGRPDLRLLARYEDKAKLVGIDRPTEEIISLLSKDEQGASTSEKRLKLVAIVGAGGMGKTTLANVVYQKLVEKFDCTAFLSVSLQPNVKNILSSILRQVMASKASEIKQDQVEAEDKDNKNKRLHRRESQKHYGNTETWSDTELIDKIKQVLENRRFLILIDDIWDEQPWKLIKCALFANKLGSKVIMTTRNNKVAEACCSSDEVDGIIHKMQPLSDGDSKKLLYYKIFGMDRCPSEDLEDVSQRILEKYKGWPLAITTIASLLKSAQTKDQWESVYNSISTGLKNNDGVMDMRSILSLSYHDMPAQLRDCFLYLSIFPEDHIIERDDLIQRWIAEDLVRGRQDDNLNELGDKYFNELINRCMIQPRDVDAFGRAQACTVHDLVLEFVIVKSAEEDFLTILNDKQSFPSDQTDSIHRLSLRNREGKHGIPKTTNRLPHVRTLVVSSHGINSMPPLSVFPVLRVLELEDCTECNIKGVENLVHLRYLRLVQAQGYHFYHHDVCIDLPKGIGNLQFLQTLDLKGARIKALPQTVVQFRQLRVLEISLRKWDKKFEKRFIKFLCNVEQLEALCIIAPGLSLDFMLQVNWTPRHLRKFTASPRKQTEHILRRGSVWAVLSPFSTLPRWINSSLSGLSNLSIMVRTLKQADLEILANLPILRSVDLEVVEASGTRLEINGGTAFRCLGNLKFASRAVGLVFKPGAMQQLQNLGLCFDVAETKDVFDDFGFGIAGLENLTSLKILNVELDCRCARLREVEAAEAALCNATELNPSCPSLDLKRHFEEEMLLDQEEETSEHLQANTKKEDALLSRVGPFGGNGGRARDIRLAPHRLINVTICSGRDNVDSLAFSYADHNGQQHSAGPWGGRNWRVSTIPLGTSEYLIKVSGTTGSCHGIDKLITSLTFVTNAASYGPFGECDGDPFEFQVPSNSSIVGFFGRAGLSLDAIGFYFRPV